MKKCPYCAEKIQDKAVVCKHCGRELVSPEKIAQTTAPKQRAPLWLVLVTFVLIAGVCGLIGSLNGGEETPVSAGATSIPEITPASEIDRNVKAIMDGIGLSEAEAEAALEVLKGTGFEAIEAAYYDQEIENLKLYNALMDCLDGYCREFTIKTEQNQIVYIGDNSRIYYHKTSGVVNHYSNYRLTGDEREIFKTIALETVKAALIDPESAIFPDEDLGSRWGIFRNNDIVTVSAWVSANNNLGIRQDMVFAVQFRYITNDLLYIEIDGEVVFGSAQEQ